MSADEMLIFERSGTFKRRNTSFKLQEPELELEDNMKNVENSSKSLKRLHIPMEEAQQRKMKIFREDSFSIGSIAQ